jgi:hypothetical protein
MHRSFSSDSTSSADDECVCVTPPPGRCEELESYGGEDVKSSDGVKPTFDRGLGLDIGELLGIYT